MKMGEPKVNFLVVNLLVKIQTCVIFNLCLKGFNNETLSLGIMGILWGNFWYLFCLLVNLNLLSPPYPCKMPCPGGWRISRSVGCW